MHMARPRLKPSGKWEISLSHPSLAKGRKAFSFDTEAQAASYAEQWRLMKLAGVEPPTELLKSTVSATVTLAHIIRAWINSGLAAPTAYSPLGSLLMEVGSVKLADANYAWLAGYLQSLKVKNNLAPGSVRHRIQGLSRAIDEYLRHNPDVVFANPVKLLPKGYSSYTDLDKRLVLASGGRVKVDVTRDRRLHAGEQERIVAALSGYQRPDRERSLLLAGGNALLTMFFVIVYTGLRLREAYMLKRGSIDLVNKVIRVQSSKQWRGKVAFRDAPMRPEVHAALVLYLSTRSMLPGAYLFPFMDEEPGVEMRTVSARVSSRYATAFEYADCPDLREHDLRHEATCRWLEMRDPAGNWMFRAEEINRIMGWSTGSAMAQRYASFRGADLAARMWAAPEASGAVSSS